MRGRILQRRRKRLHESVRMPQQESILGRGCSGSRPVNASNRRTCTLHFAAVRDSIYNHKERQLVTVAF